MVTVRPVEEKDAEAFVELRASVDAQTDFMLHGAGERSTDVEKERERIREMPQLGNHAVFVAEKEGTLVGYIGAFGHRTLRSFGNITIAIGVLRGHWGEGIGKKLFETVERWARDKSFWRLELEVMAHNDRAIALYKRMGFEVEGTKKRELLVNGAFVDNLIMAKLLE